MTSFTLSDIAFLSKPGIFLPSQVPDLQAWYHSTFTGAAPDAGVSSWADLSGNNRPALQDVSASRPIRKDNAVGGRTAVRFDGNDFLKTGTFTAIPQPITMFVLAKLTGNAPVLGAMVDGNTALSCLLYADASPANFRMYAGVSEVSAAASDFNPHVHVAQFNGAQSKIWTDGGSGFTGNAGTGNLAAITLGANGGTGSNFFIGDGVEYCIYGGRLLTLTEINSIGEYLANSVALTWTTAT